VTEKVCPRFIQGIAMEQKTVNKEQKNQVVWKKDLKIVSDPLELQNAIARRASTPRASTASLARKRVTQLKDNREDKTEG